MSLHPLLARQLRKAGLDASRPPDDAVAWERLITSVNRAYTQADRDRELMERSLDISSGEMRELYDRVNAHNGELERLVSERTGELRRAMQQAEEANRVKDRILANTSHEMRTPLNCLIGFVDLMLRGADADDAATRRKWIGYMRDSARHLLSLISNLLDLSKLEAERLDIEMVPCRMVETVLSSVSSVQHLALDKGISLQTSVGEGCPDEILSDAARVRQIVLNLLSNAIKFTERGGVLVRLERAGTPEQPRIRIGVTDTGVGINANDIPRLFNPFVQVDMSSTRRFGGTGLGLSIARRLAHRLQGDISVSSEVGKGSTFVLEITAPPLLPGQSVPPAATTNTPPPPMPSLIGRRILVVDDNETNLSLFEIALHKVGADVVLAGNGQEALDATGEFDAIVMDMQMPVMDGRQATRELRRRGVECPILALTASANPGDREAFLAAGCSDYLSKPVDLDNLVRVLAASLGHATSGASGTASGPVVDTDPMIREVADQWLSELSDRIAEMEQALTRNDLFGLERMAHAVKGTSGTLGLNGFVPIAVRLELACRAGDRTLVQTEIFAMELLRAREREIRAAA